LVRRAYIIKEPDIILRFLKGWIEDICLLKAKPELSIAVIGKYVASRDAEILKSIYTHYRDKIVTKPVPYARVVKSMLYLLSRTNPEGAGANRKVSSTAALSPSSKAPAFSTN
jgi:hypothetical protein